MKGSNSSKYFSLTVQEIFPSGNYNGEYFIVKENSSGLNKYEMDIEDVDNLIKFLKNSSGVSFLDSSPVHINGAINKKALIKILPCAHISDSVIILVPISTTYKEEISRFLTMMRKYLDDESYFSFISKISFVVVGSEQGVNSEKGREAVKLILSNVIQEFEIPKERVFFIPFSKSLSNQPINWSDVPYVIQDKFREICTMIISDTNKNLNKGLRRE